MDLVSPMRDPIGRQMHGVYRPVSCQGGTYVQRASATRKREYPGGDSNNDGSRRPYRDQRPHDRGKYPNQGGRCPDQGGYPDGGLPGGGHTNRYGRPLEEEDTMAEDLLMEMENLLVMEDSLDLLVAKDHQALKDHLDQ